MECLDPENRQCHGVFIDGAPGISKTILATEAANKLRNDKRHVLLRASTAKTLTLSNPSQKASLSKFAVRLPLTIQLPKYRSA